MNDVREIASRSTSDDAALFCARIRSDAAIFARHQPSPEATDEPVSDNQQAATSLPEPGWNMDRPSSRLQWLYPFQTLALGQRIFVAERVGLAEAAVRAVRAYSRHAQKKLNTSRGWFNYEWRNVHGVRGVVIGRIA